MKGLTAERKDLGRRLADLRHEESQATSTLEDLNRALEVAEQAETDAKAPFDAEAARYVRLVSALAISPQQDAGAHDDVAMYLSDATPADAPLVSGDRDQPHQPARDSRRVARFTARALSRAEDVATRSVAPANPWA